MWWSKPPVIPPEKIHGRYGLFVLSDEDRGKSAVEILTAREPTTEFLFWRGDLLTTPKLTRFAISREKVKIKGDEFRLAAPFAFKAGEKAIGFIRMRGTVQNEELIAPFAYNLSIDRRLTVGGILVRLDVMDSPETVEWARSLGLPP